MMMYRSRSALVLGAIVSLMIPRLAIAADLSTAKISAGGTAGVLFAQYDGPGYDGPGYDGPYDGPGGGYDDGPMGGMPPGAYDGGPHRNGPGYAARPYHDEPLRHGVLYTYHGFRIEVSRGAGASDAVASVEHQIDIIDSVGLSVSDLRLFRSVLIRVGRGPVQKSHYSAGPTVTINAPSVSDNRPILLYEYMHVLQYKGLPGGYYNADIRHFYAEAKGEGLYKHGAFLLSAPAEFFAMTASCYLYGTVAREPFNREAIRQKQPDYYAYLERLFGPARGSHLSTDGSDALKPRLISPKRVLTAAWTAG